MRDWAEVGELALRLVHDAEKAGVVCKTAEDKDIPDRHYVCDDVLPGADGMVLIEQLRRVTLLRGRMFIERRSGPRYDTVLVEATYDQALAYLLEKRSEEK